MRGSAAFFLAWIKISIHCLPARSLCTGVYPPEAQLQGDYSRHSRAQLMPAFVGPAIGEDAREFRRDRNPGGEQAVHDVRADAGGTEDAGHRAFFIRAV